MSERIGFESCGQVTEVSSVVVSPDALCEYLGTSKAEIEQRYRNTWYPATDTRWTDPTPTQKCPNCSFAITWHKTHCCKACEKTPDHHGRFCDRKQHVP
jgi:hypothetical protein